MTTTTKSQTVAADIAHLLRARNPLLWIVTKEEARVERYLIEAAAAAAYVPRCWDVAQGVTGIDGKRQNIGSYDPGEQLAFIAERAQATGAPERGAWIMRDLPAWLAGPQNVVTLRQLRNLARLLPGIGRSSAQAVMIISPSAEVPPELADHATVIDWPMPDREEIAGILDAAIGSLPEYHNTKNEAGETVPDTSRPFRAIAAPNGVRDAAIDAAVGLSGDEAAACFAKSIVQHKRMDAPAIANEKKRVISREKILEWFDPLPGGLEAVGGLENLKSWLVARKSAYSAKARAYGLPAPKGCLLGGIPGCGKSLTAKAIATAWGVPLLKVDLGAMKSKFVGESEGNLRKAFRVIEAIGRCVVWFDEIEKSLQGATSGASDGGVSSDALGAVLSWMQDRRGEAFVIATANDVESLPAELLRKGRFDEIWWIDLPNQNERCQILLAALRQHGRDIEELRGPKAPALYRIATACDGFTGSEIAALVPDVMFEAFADGAREISPADLIRAASTVVPLAKTASERINRLRNWATGRTRLASIGAPETVSPTATASRSVDI